MAEYAMSEKKFAMARKVILLSMNNTGIMVHKIIYYNILYMAEYSMSRKKFVTAR